MSSAFYVISFVLTGFLMIISLLIMYYHRLNRKRRMLIQKVQKLIKMKESIDLFRRIMPRKNISNKRKLNKILIIKKKKQLLIQKLLKKDNILIHK